MRLGVLGTMVWDRIDHPDSEIVEGWGGVAYSLAAAAAAAPSDWVIRPIVKVGDDLADEARRFMTSLPGVELGPGVVRTDAPNNRVRLEYIDRDHRHEFLTGGVPAWRWTELEPVLEGIDALYVNLISGFELDVVTATRLRGRVDGPVYADLHSLLLGLGTDGAQRPPRPLARRDEWLAAFDVVQVNEQELRLVAAGDDPGSVAEEAVRRGLVALLVTRGGDGVAVVADRPRDSEDPVRSRQDRAGPDGKGPVVPHRWVVPVGAGWTTGDPTGCGDVWGATCFVALCRGAALERAVHAANAAASRNVRHHGTDGLYTVLKEDR